MPVTVRATIRITVDQGASAQIGVQAARRTVTDTTRRVLNRGTILTPVKTGNLRSKNNSRVQQQGLRVVGTVFNQTNYAAAVHDGSKAHTIRPRSKKVLKFLIDGEVVFAKSVNHPGTKGQPWLRRALEEIAGSEGYTITNG
jgi:hypothetical protein